MSATVAEIHNNEISLFANIQPEIFENILEYLTWYDIQTCRLVCRSWYLKSYLKKITSKLLIRFTKGTFNTSSEIMKWYLKQIDFYPNLHLYDVDFSTMNHTEYLELWQQIGPKLNSLKIKHCGLPLERLKILFQQILNITTLNINEIHSVALEKGIYEEYYADIENFEPNTLGEIPVQLQKLTRFIYNYNLILSDQLFTSLMNMMPNLEALHIIRICETPPEDMDISWGKLFEFIKRQSGKLKSLAIHGWAVKQESLADMTGLDDLKLDELDISVNYYYADDDSMLSAFLKKQTTLKKLKLSSWAVSNENFIVICDYLKNLESLTIETYTMADEVTSHLCKLKKLKKLRLTGKPLEYKVAFDSLLHTDNSTLVSLEFIPHDYSEVFFDNLYRLPNLNYLNLYNSEGLVHDRDVNLISKYLLKLERLLIKRSNFTDQTFIGTENGNNSISNLTRLEELCIYNLEAITDKSCDAISKLSNLQILNMTGSQITNSGLQLIVEKCLQIQELRLFHCAQITEEGYLMLFDNLKQLDSLLMDKEQRDHLVTIKPNLIVKYLKNELCLNGQEIVFEVLIGGILYPKNSLSTLEVVATGSPERFFKYIPCLRNLKVLLICNCGLSLVTDREVNIIAKHLRQLESLTMYFSQYTDVSFIGTENEFNAISNLKKLYELRLSRLDAVTDISCVPISELRNLRTLDLTGTQITNSGIQQIVENCWKIEDLRISNCKFITEPGFVAILNKLPKLKSLYCLDRQLKMMSEMNLPVSNDKLKAICCIDFNRFRDGSNPLDD